MKNIFNSIKLQKPKTNDFDLTHDVKMSGKMGQLMPTCLMECVPGDKFQIGSDVFIRFAPLIAPVMHRIDASVHYFFVPNRILWDNWEKFMANEDTGGLPFFTVDGTETDSQKRLMDYLGVPPPPNGATSTDINALPFAAYQSVYEEYYRDQNNINTPVDYKLQDGNNNIGTFMDLQNRAWEHDYFTSALPWPQKGEDVEIPLGDVTLKNDLSNSSPYFVDDQGQPGFNGDVQNNTVNPGQERIDIQGASGPYLYDPDGSLQTESTTINALRRAMRLQEWLEKNARGGTRYIEQIKAHFGVNSSDKRLQRPEYISGVKTPVTISEIANTTGEVGGEPQGTLAGKGTSVGTGYTSNYYCEEHGYIIGIMSVMPKTNYMQGIPRTYLRKDPLDYFWPSFAHIGEQEIQNQELYAYTGTKDETFGYIPRYAEYKYQPSRVAGDFRDSLDYWHLGRKFANQPALNKTFIECTPADVSRIFAVQDGSDNLWMEIVNKVKAKRPMPVFGTPYL